MNARPIATALLWTATAAAWAQTPVVAGPDVDAPSGTLHQRPLWELGVGVSALRLPDYRGSDESHGYVLPIPYFVYRGTWLKADRDGARALLFNSPRAKVDLSFGASAPTHSGNKAREGMPKLPGNAEVGPSMNLTLAESDRKRDWKLDLRLPVRAAVTLQRSPRFVGLTFSPNLNLDVKSDDGNTNVGVLTGPLFASAKYHEQYYGVDAAYATPERPAYQAHGGYAGWQLLGSSSRRFGNTWVGGFLRYENLSGAAYEDSPLVRRKSALTFGFAVSWILTTSSQTVASPE